MTWCIPRAIARISCRRASQRGNIWNRSFPQTSFGKLAHTRQSPGPTHLGRGHRLSCNKVSLPFNRQSRHFSVTTLSQHRAAKDTTAASSVAASGPQLPLSERPNQAEVSLQDLFNWHSTAQAQAKAIGAAFVEEDDGPSAEDLLIELNWLLDDAVAAQQSSSDAWTPCSWCHLQSVHQRPKGMDVTPNHDPKVALRLGMSHLTDLWKQRTQNRVPLQYLTNCCHWRDMVLAVGPGVLIPRPETELLIDFAQQALQRRPDLGAGPWLDLGTGSGAIALGLASILPKATQVYAVDSSSAALAWAQLNVDRLNLASRVLYNVAYLRKYLTVEWSMQLKHGSWYSPVEHIKFAGIVSNPPYIPHNQMQHLQKEVGQFEPWLALDGGVGLGLDSLTPVCSGATTMLQPGGFLAIETTGGKQASDVASALKYSKMFERVEVVSDLAGHERFIKAFRTTVSL